MADTALITGATGFVGCAVARHVAARGWTVRALVRTTSPRGQLAGIEIDWAEGDLRDREAVRRAMAGARRVFHVAADYRLWTRSPQSLAASNVEGTRIIMEEARRAGVERIVHTSSVATLRLNDNGSPADESRSLSEAEGIGAYKKSKIAAESIVLAMAREGLPVVVVNPSTPLGPNDVRPTPTGRIVIEAARGRMPAFVDTGLNVVHVEDVAAGHVAAAERGRIGERYILGGDDVLLRELLATVARACGRQPPTLGIPRLFAYPAAFVSEAMARITGREPFVTVVGVAMARHRMFFSSQKARDELGYRSRPYTAAVEDAVRWFRESGRLEPAPALSQGRR
jgi:dihydroflavonol-4-reductase